MPEKSKVPGQRGWQPLLLVCVMWVCWATETWGGFYDYFLKSRIYLSDANELHTHTDARTHTLRNSKTSKSAILGLNWIFEVHKIRTWKTRIYTHTHTRHTSTGREKFERWSMHPLLTRRNASCIRDNRCRRYFASNPNYLLTESLMTLIMWMELGTYLVWSNYEACTVLWKDHQIHAWHRRLRE